MVAQYRQRALDCPGCGAFLSARPGDATTGDALSDESVAGTLRCEQCGGLWIDWFAGDVVTLLRTLPLPEARRSRPSAPHATGSCPRCHLALASHELPQAEGLYAWACGRCGGRFVALSEALSLAASVEPPEPSRWWSRPVNVVRGLVRSLWRRRG